MIGRVALAFAVLTLPFAIAHAQTAPAQAAQAAAGQPQTDASPLFSGNANFQYREPIGADGDQSKARAKILTDAEKDCETLGKAFGRRCVINNINFNTAPFTMQLQQQAVVLSQGQSQPNGWYLSANVNLQLLADPTKPQ